MRLLPLIKAEITAVMVAPLIADSQAVVGVTEAAAPASQLKVYHAALLHYVGLIA